MQEPRELLLLTTQMQAATDCYACHLSANCQTPQCQTSTGCQSYLADLSCRLSLISSSTEGKLCCGGATTCREKLSITCTAASKHNTFAPRDTEHPQLLYAAVMQGNMCVAACSTPSSSGLHNARDTLSIDPCTHTHTHCALLLAVLQPTNNTDVVHIHYTLSQLSAELKGRAYIWQRAVRCHTPLDSQQPLPPALAPLGHQSCAAVPCTAAQLTAVAAALVC
jgi:hypothetical protein